MRKPSLTLLALVAIVSALFAGQGCTQPSGQQDISIPQKDTLTLFDTGPITLDPAISQESTSHTYVMQIFSGLVRLDQNMEPVGDIAEEWEMAGGGTVYTFHLLQNATFHDGKQITARDFKYSWERACRPETGSPTASTYLNDIVGARQVLDGQAQEIVGINVVDDYTLQVTIDAPKAYFLAKMTYPVAFVVDQSNVAAGEEWWRAPNGSGPFKLEAWREDQLLILERNELYYRDKAGVEHIVFLLWGGVPMQMYENGEIDVTYVSLGNLERALDQSNPLHDELMVFPELSITFIGFNCTGQPFDHADVRLALCHAVDRQGLVTQFLKDSVTAAGCILPPGMPGHSDEVTGPGYDLEQAAALLSQAGYSNTTAFPSVVFSAPGEGCNVASWLTAILWGWNQDLDVPCEVVQLESEAYFYRLDEELGDMFLFGWVADYPDPQNFLEVLFHSDSVNNYANYSNPQVDALLEQAAVEQDTSTRFDLYRQAEQLIVSDGACIPLWFGINYVLIKPHVKGYTLNPLGIPLLAQVSVEE